jgi:outer membrane protein TolC
MRKINLIIAAFLLLSISAFSQGKMSLSEAILYALENNNNVKLSENSVIIRENLSSLGQAGLLPSLNASGMADFGQNNYEVQPNGSPNVSKTTGVESRTYNAAVNLNYTIFSGFSNLKTYEKLKVNIDLAKADHKVNVENIILQVASSYFNVIRTQDNYQALLESIEISEKRFQLEDARRELSAGTKLNLLNAKVSLMKDSVSLFDAQLAKENAIIAFNKAINAPLDTQLVLESEILKNNQYVLEDLRQQMMSQNPELLSLRYQEQVSMLDYKIAKSSFSPTLSLGSSYSYTYNEGSIQFDYSKSDGLGVSLNLSVPIYNGGHKVAALKNAKVQMDNVYLQQQELELQLEMNLLSAYKDYDIAIKKVAMENKNVETAELNFQLSDERYKLGQIINTQYREAQLNLILAKNNLNNSKFNAKLAELEIIKLSGLLLNNTQK